MDENKKSIDTAIADDRHMLRNAEEHIAKLTCELKEREAEKAHYLKENEYYREMLRRLTGI